MKNLFLLACGILAMLASACSSGSQESQTDSPEAAYGNPAAPGFNMTGSDAAAITLADSVMEAMGGRKAWDETRYLQWNFLGRRTLLWDKQAHRVRIETPSRGLVYMLDLEQGSGQIAQAGELLTDPSLVDSLISRGKSLWINDSYWLVMPFKLKDSGVTLKHLGQDTTKDGATAEVISLTFNNVGDTPENFYKVYIDPVSYQLTQWDFYPTADSETPAIQTLWQDYRMYGNILLSGKRENYMLTDIAVHDAVPDSVFQATQLILATD